MAITEREAAMLEFERSWWKHPGAKDAAIRETFEVGAVTYYAELNALIGREDALVAEPMLVRRLRRLRDGRIASRERCYFAATSGPSDRSIHAQK